MQWCRVRTCQPGNAYASHQCQRRLAPKSATRRHKEILLRNRLAGVVTRRGRDLQTPDGVRGLVPCLDLLRLGVACTVKSLIAANVGTASKLHEHSTSATAHCSIRSAT